jgi:hypothetical protein
MTERMFGKYRGVVWNNVDPSGLLRILVSVPAVYDANQLRWALPCLPGAGPNCGLALLPPIKAHVWVEFEGGNPDYPIWSGGFWENAKDVPGQSTGGVNPPHDVVLQTECESSLRLVGGFADPIAELRTRIGKISTSEGQFELGSDR